MPAAPHPVTAASETPSRETRVAAVEAAEIAAGETMPMKAPVVATEPARTAAPGKTAMPLRAAKTFMAATMEPEAAARMPHFARAAKPVASTAAAETAPAAAMMLPAAMRLRLRGWRQGQRSHQAPYETSRH